MSSDYFIHIPKSARKSLRKAPLPWQVRILDVLTRLQSDPQLGEKMKGKYADKRKVKVWPYRIIYRIREDIRLIEVMEIEHRGHVSYN